MMSNTAIRNTNLSEKPKNAREQFAEDYQEKLTAYLGERDATFWKRDLISRVGAFFVRAGYSLLRLLSRGRFNYRYQTEKEKRTQYIENQLKPALINYAKSKSADEIAAQKEILIDLMNNGLSRFSPRAKKNYGHDLKNKAAYESSLHFLLSSAKKAIPILLNMAEDALNHILSFLGPSDVHVLAQTSMEANDLLKEELMLRKLLKHIEQGEIENAEAILKEVNISLRSRFLVNKGIVVNEDQSYNLTALQCALYFLTGRQKKAMERMILKYLSYRSAKLQRTELNDISNAKSEKLQALKVAVHALEEKGRAKDEEIRQLKTALTNKSMARFCYTETEEKEKNNTPLSVTAVSLFREAPPLQACSSGTPTQIAAPSTLDLAPFQ